jgi:energy-converting hydrogenase Eha subunit F
MSMAMIIYLTVVIIILIVLSSKLSPKLDIDINVKLFAIKLFLSFLIGILFVADLYCFIEFLYPSPTPMDVYSGKTTLEYTVVDGIKTDSCVVWKSDIKK